MANKDSLISKEILHELFEYRDGLLFYKSTGKEAKSLQYNGYIRVKINKICYLAHRIVFMMHHGYIPKSLDHKDGNKLNNSIENLRPATDSENNCNRKIHKNNKSGVKGVNWHKGNNKWCAVCSINGKQNLIGYFDNIEKAKIAVELFRKDHHGEFARS